MKKLVSGLLGVAVGVAAVELGLLRFLKSRVDSSSCCGGKRPCCEDTADVAADDVSEDAHDVSGETVEGTA